MKETILQTIRQIEAEKIRQNISPNYATLLELRRRIVGDIIPDLQDLYKLGIIKVGDTINDKYIYIASKHDTPIYEAFFNPDQQKYP